MKWISSIFLLVIVSCSRPTAHVFKDDALKQQEEAKLCFLGDLGLDTPVQEIVAQELKEENCDRIFFLGDLVYPDGIKNLDDPQLQNKFLTYYNPLFEDHPSLKIYLTLGNHDYGGNPEAWLEIGKAHPGFVFPHYYYMVDFGNLCIVAFDTNFFVEKSYAPKAVKQTAWMTNLDKKLKQCDAKIAISHHPYKGNEFPGSKDWEGATGAMKIFFDTFIIGKMDMHIAGHVHALEEDGEDEGTTLLVSGAGGETRADASTPGFVVVTWEPGNSKKLTYRLVRLENIYIPENE